MICTNHPKLPCGTKGLLTLHCISTAWSGDDVHFGLVSIELLLEAKTILLPMIGGFSQLPLSLTKSGSTSSAHLVVAVSFTLPSGLHGNIAHGIANTVQLPAISLNGFGNFTPRLYGHTQIAIPSPNVMVGAIYNLNCDVVQPKIAHAPEGDGGQIGMVLSVGNASKGSHLPNVLLSAAKNFGTQPKIWYCPGAKKA